MKLKLLVFLAALFMMSASFADSHEADQPLAFIKAANLLEQMQNDSGLYVFDVRTLGEYDQGHIDGSRSLPLNEINQPRLNNVAGLSRDSEIVTYCGCPHHLSGLAAKQLISMSYKNVRVLEEGFWYWKEQQYPILPAMSDVKVSELSVSGKLIADSKPVNDVDIFIRHARSGQLEATKTDENGHYAMHLHLYGYKNNDTFEFYVANLSNKPVRTFIPDTDSETDVVVTY